jgi:hypothetical protein
MLGVIGGRDGTWHKRKAEARGQGPGAEGSNKETGRAHEARGRNQPQRAHRQATAASVAAERVHAGGGGEDGVCRADRLARPRAVGGAAFGVEHGLAEVRVSVVIDRDHDPRPRGVGAEPLRRPDAFVNSGHDRRVSGAVDTIGAGERVDERDVADLWRVLVARSADDLDPVPLLQRLGGRCCAQPRREARYVALFSKAHRGFSRQSAA